MTWVTVLEGYCIVSAAFCGTWVGLIMLFRYIK